MLQKPVKFIVKGLCQLDIPWEIAQNVPNIRLSMSISCQESQSRKYIFRAETTIKAIKDYFLSIKTGKLKTDSLADVILLAYNLGDLNYSDKYLLPDLQDLSDGDLIKIPEPALYKYVKQYLQEIFNPECICGYEFSQNIQQSSDNNPTSEIYLIVYEFRRYFDDRKINYPAKAKDRGALYSKNMGNLIVTLNRMKLYIINSQNFPLICKQFVGLPQTTRIWIMNRICCIYICNISLSFYNSWLNFICERRELANFLWNNMDRDNLLNIGGVNKFKPQYNSMKKKEFCELQKYIELFSNKCV